jgi:hypothetical protein
MVAVLVLVSEEEPDEVWVTFVSAAESLKNFDLSLIFFSLFSMKCFDGEVLFIGALITWNNVLAIPAMINECLETSRTSVSY